MEFWKPEPGQDARIRFMEPVPAYNRHWVKLPPAKYVCADCGNEQHSMDTVCARCSSVRVVSIEWLEELVGPNWREAFDAK